MTTGDPTTATVRPVERADLLEVLRIEKAAFPQPWSYAAFERFLEEPGFLVATGEPEAGAEAEGGSGSGSGTEGGHGLGPGIDGPPVLGYVVADAIPRHGGPLGHVKDIAVHPDHRGRGLGRRLLGAGLRALRGQGVRTVKLEVRRSNEVARRLYRDVGFVHDRTAPRYYDDGEDALVMLLDLEAQADAGTGADPEGVDL